MAAMGPWVCVEHATRVYIASHQFHQQMGKILVLDQPMQSHALIDSRRNLDATLGSSVRGLRSARVVIVQTYLPIGCSSGRELLPTAKKAVSF